MLIRELGNSVWNSNKRSKLDMWIWKSSAWSHETDEKWKVKVKSLSRVWLFETPWTVAYNIPPSWDFPGKNTGVGCHFLLQRIFLTQGSNLCLPHCRQMLYHLSHQGSKVTRPDESTLQRNVDREGRRVMSWTLKSFRL